MQVKRNKKYILYVFFFIYYNLKNFPRKGNPQECPFNYPTWHLLICSYLIIINLEGSSCFNILFIIFQNKKGNLENHIKRWSNPQKVPNYVSGMHVAFSITCIQSFWCTNGILFHLESFFNIICTFWKKNRLKVTLIFSLLSLLDLGHLTMVSSSIYVD